MRRLTFVVATVALLSACGRAQNPTSPSSVTAASPAALREGASSPAPFPTQTASGVVDWSLLTSHTQRPVVPQDVGFDAPSAPSNLAFTVSGTTVIFTWSPPGSGGATSSYIIEAGSASGLSDIVSFNTGSTATTLTVTSVPAGTYLVRVRARNADGTSGPSNEVTIVVDGGGGSCPAPAAPAGFGASATGNTVTLTWNAVAGALSYVIEAGSASGAGNIFTFDTNSTATSFSGNAPNSTYFLRVRVRTACGLSAASNEVALTVGGSTPPAGSLTGFWRGTVTVVEGSSTTTQEIEVDVTHSGTRLTGLVRGGRQVTLDLTQSASDPSRYDGILYVPGDTSGCESKQGGLTAQGTTRLSGTFTTGCGANTIDITKVS